MGRGEGAVWISSDDVVCLPGIVWSESFSADVADDRCVSDPLGLFLIVTVVESPFLCLSLRGVHLVFLASGFVLDPVGFASVSIRQRATFDAGALEPVRH